MDAGHRPDEGDPTAEDATRWMLLYPRLAVFFREVQRQTSFSATELAVLFALDPAGSTAVGMLRERLAADRGHLSRVLARFEREGIIVRASSGSDHRRQQVTLTGLGIQRRAGLAAVVAEAALAYPFLQAERAGPLLASPGPERGLLWY